MTAAEVLERLAAAADPAHAAKLARFSIVADRPFGVPVPVQRRIARECGLNMDTALELWADGRHEARMTASMIAPPDGFTPQLMDEWVAGFRSWDICDGCCANLFRNTTFAFDKIGEYVRREEEYFRRAGFVLMAEYAIGDKRRNDEDFVAFFPLIREYSADGRNFVRKAVNWALRQIGKRSHYLHSQAIALGTELAASGNKSARWVGRDALRELTSPKVAARIKR